jgi:hypothetical protein
MKEIEDEMKNYYTLLIEMKRRNPESEWVERVTHQEVKSLPKSGWVNKKSVNRIVTDDGFDNCSNFVK